MVEFLTIFMTSFTVALSGALMPGPLLTVTISESARRGYIAGPLLMVGHGVLELALIVAIRLGLDAYLKMAPVMAASALLGGSVLLYLGIEMVRTAGRYSIQGRNPGSSASCRTPVITGALTSLANPYWTLWWATFGLGYMTKISGAGLPGIAVFFAGHIAADFAWYSMVSFGVSRGAMVMRDGAYHALLRACGVFLVLFGGWFLVTAKDFFLGTVS
ncbi:MAG: LysE family transporter [Syntrophobacteraceae bacterium]|jgi:threonine/homoserine/homoserine lactone efflux protein